MTGPPPLRPWSRAAVPLPTGSESAAFDATAITEAGVPEPALMETAGRSVATVAELLFPHGEVVGLVGGGNNGGDALVALRTLVAWGRPVRVVLGADRDPADPLLHGWSLEIERDVALDDDALDSRLAGAGLVLDGLLGTGIRGPARDRTARLVRAANQVSAPILALDVPSGVDADRGAVEGDAVEADLTVAFGWPKLGTLLHPARAYTGRILAVEIGFPPPPGRWSARLLTPAWAAARRPARPPDTHKNRVGSVLVVGGRSGMAGAVVLAARSALRAGAGFVRVASWESNREVLQKAVPDAPFVDLDDDGALAEALEASSAVAIGPGLGTDGAAESALAAVLEGPERPTVLDADALNLLAAGRPMPAAGVGVGRPVVLTPHAGEMSRLVGTPVEAIQRDRPAAARGLADSAGCVVVLKGAPSLVAGKGALGVSALGGSELAVAGMGDVLTGAVAAFLAQGLDPFDAAGVALVATARAALCTGFGSGMAAGDVPDQIAAAVAELGPGVTGLSLPGLTLDLDPAS